MGKTLMMEKTETGELLSKLDLFWYNSAGDGTREQLLTAETEV